MGSTSSAPAGRGLQSARETKSPETAQDKPKPPRMEQSIHPPLAAHFGLCAALLAPTGSSTHTIQAV
jgi:hypothetical protein